MSWTLSAWFVPAYRLIVTRLIFRACIYISLNKASYCDLELCHIWSLVYFGTKSLQKQWQQPPTPIGCTDHLSVYLWIRVNGEIPSKSAVPEVQTSRPSVPNSGNVMTFSQVGDWLGREFRVLWLITSQCAKNDRAQLSRSCATITYCLQVHSP
jgi:hypothetical protein